MGPLSDAEIRKIKNGSVAARGRGLWGTPKVVRLYADRDTLRIYFFCLWGVGSRS